MNNFLKKVIIEKQRELEIAKRSLRNPFLTQIYANPTQINADFPRRHLRPSACNLRESAFKKGFFRNFAKAIDRSFKDSLRRDDSIKLIAEIKYRSPSKGSFGCRLTPEILARIYEDSGATAISVLTDREFFDGDIGHLSTVKQASSLPVLRKDFIIDEYQVYESKAFGADAILLIAQILPEKKLNQLHSLAGSLGMDIMVEVHSENDLKKTKAIRPEIIGINNRNLKTFQVDLKITERLIKKIPKDIIRVSESGIQNYKDVQYLKGLGVDAVLVGETFMRSKNIAKKVRELMGRSPKTRS